MKFEFSPGERADAGTRRLAITLIDDAVLQTEDRTIDPAEAIHEGRKDMKSLLAADGNQRGRQPKSRALRLDRRRHHWKRATDCPTSLGGQANAGFSQSPSKRHGIA